MINEIEHHGLASILADYFLDTYVTVQLLSKSEMLFQNKQLLNHDYYTDVITSFFDQPNAKEVHILICPELVQENAKKLGVDKSLEMRRILFHALLHTQGFNDRSVTQKNLMRLLENELLSCSTWKQNLTLS